MALTRMPVIVHLTAGDSRHEMQLTVRDTAIDTAVLHPFYQTVFAQKTASLEHLLELATEFLRLLESQRSLLEHDYRVRMTLFGKRQVVASRAARAGFKVDGQFAFITGGPSRCYIETMRILPDGKGEVDRRIDLRSLEKVETDDAGTIDVIKRPVRLNWFGQLPAAISFLRQADATEVRCSAVWGRPSVLQLVKRLRIGDDPGGGIGEELFRMSDEGRDGLIKLLDNFRQRRYHETAVRFLCSMFPSHSTRIAVDRLIAQTQDEAAKASFRKILDQMRF